VRCPRCGNENLDQNRFCGMCGASLLSSSAPKPAETQPVSVAASPTTTQVAAEPVHDSSPSASQSPSSFSISGPSFLGLNDPAPSRTAPRKRASLSIDPHSAPGSNLDYLLDEEEPTHHWGIGKILLILIALGLAAGFGYLRFKNQGLAWLNPSKKPSAVVQNSPTPDTTTAPPTSSITPDSPAPAQPTAAAPQPVTSDPGNAAATPAPATPAQATPAPSTPAPSDAAKSTDAPPAAPSDKAAATTDKDSTTAKEPSPDTDTPPAATKPEEKPKPTPKPPAATVPALKPSPASRLPAYDPVVEAQKYLYGRGAPHDCDRGLRLLRPAANQSNPKAMIEMGALYSAGLCTPHDLPTAYRWFALALRKDPENTAVQADLQKLWGEMTQPERQLAIKLTQ